MIRRLPRTTRTDTLVPYTTRCRAEITLQAGLRRGTAGLAPCFAIDDPQRLAALAGRLGLAVPVAESAAPGSAREIFAEALPVLPLDRAVAAEPGRLDPANAEAVLDSIRIAVALACRGEAAAVVTNPIHKQIGRAHV